MTFQANSDQHWTIETPGEDHQYTGSGDTVDLHVGPGDRPLLTAELPMSILTQSKCQPLVSQTAPSTITHATRHHRTAPTPTQCAGCANTEREPAFR